MNDDGAESDCVATTPVYYITGTIHSPETGSPTALMELVYRLAVDESPYIQKIRNKVITLVIADRGSRRTRSSRGRVSLAPGQP
jgi:hypothetical protein